jgi:hypothetical protein
MLGCYGGYVYWLRLLTGVVGWRVGVWLSFPSGNEETPPTRRTALPLGEGESLGNGAETKRPRGAWL